MANQHGEVRRGPAGGDAPAPMTDDEVIAYLWQKASVALNDTDDELSQDRQNVLGYYYGNEYGDEREGFSQQRTREVLEVVEWALPSLLRIFLSGPNAVTFTPVGEEDQEAAERESDVINHLLLRRNTYYSAVRSWFKDALLYPNGYLKVWWDESFEPVFSEYENLTMEQFVMLRYDIDQAQDVDIVNADFDEERGIVTCTVRELRSKHQLRLAPVPPEEVLVDDNLQTLDLDEASFLCHYSEPTRSSLISLGHDPELVYSLPEAERLNTSTEREVRQNTTDETWNTSEYDDGALVRVEHYECYCMLDVDGDGLAERRKIVFSGKEILENKYTDYQPLIALGSMPQSHRHVALSLGQTAMPIQRVQSTLLRQLLDNLYRVNGPRTFANGNVDLEQLMNYVPFGVVETEDPTRDVVPENIPIAVDKILPIMQWLDEELGGRVGVSKHTQGLDADTLAASTMGAFVEALGQASQRIEMVAREFAEMGVKKLALKAHHLLRKHQQQALSVRLSGGWVNTNPREWLERTDMDVHVGTGTGSPRERVASLMGVLTLQEKALPIGLTTLPRVYNALEDLVTLAGRPGAGRYFLDPESPEGQQLAQQRAQQAEEAKRAEMEQTQALLNQADKDRLSRAGEKILDMQKHATEEERKWAEAELKHDVDIAEVGIKREKVTPLR